jgi:PAS domain S-box-containing protein
MTNENNRNQQAMSDTETGTDIKATDQKHATDEGLKKVTDAFSFQPRVLVVDDEDRIQKACHRLLTQEGCEVALADNGIKGLKMIEDTHFDIVLLDLMMPGMSGMDVLTGIKARHPDTVIIVITGYATLEHSIETMKKGAFDFLSKPFSPQELRVVISKAIEFIRTLQDIASEKTRMRVMVNTLKEGVLTTDHQKAIVLANPAFLNMIGARTRTAIGRQVEEIVENPRILEMIDQALAQTAGHFSELTDELTVVPEDGKEEKIIGIRCFPFRDRLDRNLGAVTVFHDITALKKMDQLKSDFVSMVAHEIKSPLNSILMQLKVVLDGLAGDLTQKQTEMLQRSADKITSLAQLASELLDLSKIESGLINQDRETLDLGPLIREQVQFFRDKADAKSLHLIRKPFPEDLTVMANRTNIEEVLSNLISNAIRYTPSNGKIEVWADQNGDCVNLHVADTGLGIAEDELEHIFDRFYRVKNEHTRYINGTGLGLAIVKSIVESHHGTIHVESDPGQGTHFTICLPL